MILKLQCYARKCGSKWHGICTDLDIAADGASFQDAKESLTACIELHLEGIEELPTGERRRFLTRRAPWHVRTGMAALTWLDSFRSRDNPSRQKCLVWDSRIEIAGV